MPKVSIIIPFYNKDFLAEMIESVLSQEFQDWELLLINDGADNIAMETVHKYSMNDARIKVLNREQPPKGAQTCRNIGLQKSSGEYVCFFDSDDIILPYCIGNRVKYMEENKDLDFAVFRAHTFDISGKSPTRVFGARQTSDDLKFFINGIPPFAVWTNIYRRQSLLKYKVSWDEKILSLQDSDFNIQNIVKYRMKYAYYNGHKPDYLWRINHSNNSISKKIKSKEHQHSHNYFMSKTISTLHEKYGRIYDKDLSQRIYDFELSFSENNDFEMISSFNNMAQNEGINIVSVDRFKLLKMLRSAFNDNRILRVLFKFIIFPKQTFNNYHIRNKYLADTSAS